MSTRIIRQTRDPLDSLERMLNRTTLATQRVAHNQIIELGGRMLTVHTDGSKEERENAIQDAVDAAEARATREMRAALKRMKEQKNADRKRALLTQKEYFDRHAHRVAEQRDRAEEERIKELTKKLHKERDESLRVQWEECEVLKQQAVSAACDDVRNTMASEFAMEREQAIAHALKMAQVKFRKREQEVIDLTMRRSEEKAKHEANRVAKLHQAEIDKLNNEYDILESKYHRELGHKQRVENDFRALQDDYKRFLDYTDGGFHSDYLMMLRYKGMKVADKRISEVTYEDIEKPSRNGFGYLFP